MQILNHEVENLWRHTSETALAASWTVKIARPGRFLLVLNKTAAESENMFGSCSKADVTLPKRDLWSKQDIRIGNRSSGMSEGRWSRRSLIAHPNCRQWRRRKQGGAVGPGAWRENGVRPMEKGAEELIAGRDDLLCSSILYVSLLLYLLLLSSAWMAHWYWYNFHHQIALNLIELPLSSWKKQPVEIVLCSIGMEDEAKLSTMIPIRK